jgi:hypothetical protein
MAQEISRFWDYDEVKNNEYQADELAEYLRTFFTDGVPEMGTNLQIAADDSGMLVKAGYGAASVQGSLYLLKDDESGVKTLPIAAAHASLTRIDRVVLRRDKSAAVASIILAVVTGTPAASPEPPALTREGNIYEISLARVSVGPGVLSITAAMVTDEREDNDLCGLCENRVTRVRVDAVVAGLAGKANISHTQAMSTITGLLDALAAKADAAATTAALAGKQATINGGASSITAANLTASKALVSDGDGKVAASAVSATELGYMVGVSSAIQAQFSGKEATLNADQKRKITISSSDPSGGVNGDIWIKTP